jgi:hypothetical protein
MSETKLLNVLQIDLNKKNLEETFDKAPPHPLSQNKILTCPQWLDPQ